MSALASRTCGFALLLGCLALPVQAQSPIPPAQATQPASLDSVVLEPVNLAEDPNAIRILLSPELETTLVAQMVGRIAKLEAPLGGRVRKGQTLVGFDCGEAQARLRMARAEHAAARETLSAKQRLRQLEAAGDMEVSLAAAETEKSSAAIALAQAQLGHCTVPAPFDGRVVKTHVKLHQGVNVGAPLIELVSEGPLKIRLNVPSRWLRQVREGTPFEVTVNETGGTYAAKVTAVNARVDAVAQTIELEARMDGTPAELLAGMSGVARFRLDP